MKIKKSLIAESHRRQFNGEDWQRVANDLISQVKKPNDDDFYELAKSPDPSCDCGFCATAEWVD